MNIRRLVMDVDKAVKRPSLIELAQAIENTGAVVHSIDQVVAGSRLIEGIKPARQSK
jgi:hypothetical protein